MKAVQFGVGLYRHVRSGAGFGAGYQERRCSSRYSEYLPHSNLPQPTRIAHKNSQQMIVRNFWLSTDRAIPKRPHSRPKRSIFE
jgi:hypothetical protein